jgi:hypothetical protein
MSLHAFLFSRFVQLFISFLNLICFQRIFNPFTLTNLFTYKKSTMKKSLGPMKAVLRTAVRGVSSTLATPAGAAAAVNSLPSIAPPQANPHTSFYVRLLHDFKNILWTLKRLCFRSLVQRPRDSGGLRRPTTTQTHHHRQP